MELTEAVAFRKSIRGYKPDPVSREILTQVLELALRSPSTTNVQPWEITLVTGPVLDQIRQANVEAFESGAPDSPDAIEVLPYTTMSGRYRKRQVGLAVQLFGLMGIAKEDSAKRRQWLKNGLRFYDAPAAIIISIDRELGMGTVLMDAGIVSYAIALASVEYGLGTCIMRTAIRYPEIVRRFTGMPDSKRIVSCVTIGYPDWSLPANRIQTERERMSDLVTWCGFPDPAPR
ncbi:MAG: nitroreductase [Chloroflexota bacterium]